MKVGKVIKRTKLKAKVMAVFYFIDSDTKIQSERQIKEKDSLQGQNSKIKYD